MVKAPRYHDTGRGSFFGDYAYQRLLERHAGHFLIALQRLFDWEAQSQGLIRLYKGQGLVGRPPYPPVLIFKMLFLSYLYNVSERAMEELADLNLLVKWFLGCPRVRGDGAGPLHAHSVQATLPNRGTLASFAGPL